MCGGRGGGGGWAGRMAADNCRLSHLLHLTARLMGNNGCNVPPLAPLEDLPATIKIYRSDMPYTYVYADDHYTIKAGALGGIEFGKVIQDPDKYKGYNVEFIVKGETGVYHVHFFCGGSKVSVIRYIPDKSKATGVNIIKHECGETKRFGNLAHECSGYPNHHALLTKFADAIKDRPRKRNQNLAGQR